VTNFDYTPYSEDAEQWGIPTTFVYVIGGETDGPMKIGSDRPLERLKALQVGSPTPLVILRCWDATPRFERFWPGGCRDHRLSGEWFDRAALDLIDKHAEHEHYSDQTHAWLEGMPDEAYLGFRLDGVTNQGNIAEFYADYDVPEGSITPVRAALAITAYLSYCHRYDPAQPPSDNEYVEKRVAQLFGPAAEGDQDV
jgi:hypothetical protein